MSCAVVSPENSPLTFGYTSNYGQKKNKSTGGRKKIDSQVNFNF